MYQWFMRHAQRLASSQTRGQRAVHGALHELAGTLELLEELVHLLNRGAASVGDTLAAAAVYLLGMFTLVRSH